MKIAIGVLRRLIKEAAIDTIRRSKSDRVSNRSSMLGVKNKDVNVTAGDKIANKIEPEIVDMIKTAYEPIGGHPKVQNPGDLSSEYPNWVVADIDDDPEPDVAIVGRHSGPGMKLGASGTDGTSAAKAYMMKLKKKLHIGGGWWGEVSGAPAHIAINKLGIPYVDNEEKVRQLLGADKEITWHGEHPQGQFKGVNGWYSRDIGGHSHAKIIIGEV